jgi:hypothetical protein
MDKKICKKSHLQFASGIMCFYVIEVLSIWFMKCQAFLYFADYDDVPVKDVSSKVPIFSDMLKRGTSFNWSETGQQSFRIMKKKLQEATWQ